MHGVYGTAGEEEGSGVRVAGGSGVRGEGCGLRNTISHFLSPPAPTPSHTPSFSQVTALVLSALIHNLSLPLSHPHPHPHTLPLSHRSRPWSSPPSSTTSHSLSHTPTHTLTHSLFLTGHGPGPLRPHPQAQAAGRQGSRVPPASGSLNSVVLSVVRSAWSLCMHAALKWTSAFF